MATTQTHIGVPWDGRTAYEKWVEDDLKLPLQRGYAATNLSKAPVQRWEERGISAAFYDIIGAESLAGIYVGEIAPGKSTVPARQICDENIYIISGRGSATVETGGRKVDFEWGPRSMFAVPLNCRYQLHNGSGQEPVRFVSTNTIPIVYNLFRDSNFIFQNEHNFGRIDPDLNPRDSIVYKPDANRARTAVDLHETMFVRDIYETHRTNFVERGAGRTVYFEMANSNISAHVAENPGLHVNNPHRHGPSAFVYTLEGKGYTIMWRDGNDEVRFDWPEGDIGVVVPPNMWWHGHFFCSPRAMQLAIKLRSRKNPLNHLYDKTHKRVAEGGTVLKYTDLDEGLRKRMLQTFIDECRKNGYEANLPQT